MSPETTHEVDGPVPTVHLILFAGAYAAAAALGQWLMLPTDQMVTLWPPSGLYLAVLLLCDQRQWWRWVMVALPADVAIETAFYPFTLSVGLVVAAGDTLEALTGAYLVARCCGTPFRLQGPREVLGLTLLAGILSPALGGAIGALALSLAKVQTFWTGWPLWWIGDAVGVLIAAPLVLVVLEGGASWREIRGLRAAELAAMIMTLAIVAHTVFSHEPPLVYLILPPLLWATLRFGLPGAVLAMAVLTVIAIRDTAAGSGPFADPELAPGLRSHLVQSFLGIVAVSTLVLAALIDQHRRALKALNDAKDELEDRVTEGTAAAGFEHHLAKPVDLESLQDSLADQGPPS
jgi:integral membrane sensor domain MASE1